MKPAIGAALVALGMITHITAAQAVPMISLDGFPSWAAETTFINS